VQPGPPPAGEPLSAIIARCATLAYVVRGTMNAVEEPDGCKVVPFPTKALDANDVHRKLGTDAARAVTDRLPDIDFEDKPKARGNGQLEVNSEAFARNGAQHREQKPLPPPPDRASLTVSAWLNKDIPERDFLLGGVMCTTSRWFIFGETGIGKTLIAMEMAAAIAVAAAFLKWPGQRRARMMYLDGELPMETFKERMELIADRHGKDIEFYGYNREDLGDDALAPLNTDAGQAWLKREIAAIKPDLIIFDSIMCLLIGSMSEEATWMPVRPFVRWLSTQRIAQVWLHHANDLGKSFGDKTREWEMEAVIKLSKVEGDETAILFEFVKARLRTPKTAAQFLPIVIHPGDWGFESAIKSAGKRNEAEAVADAFLNALDRLADGITKSHGFGGKFVSKVKVDGIRDELKKRGFLEKNETGGLTDTGRSHFRRAKTLLLSAGKIIESEDLIWRK
jgi:AAA domain